MTAPRSADQRGRPFAWLLIVVGVLILGVDAAISVPSLIPGLLDPTSHEAEDAGMTAIFLLIPMAIVGIACLLVASLLWRTRAGDVALVTVSVVVAMVVGNLMGLPLLIPAIGVAITGGMLAVWNLYRDRG